MAGYPPNVVEAPTVEEPPIIVAKLRFFLDNLCYFFVTFSSLSGFGGASGMTGLCFSSSSERSNLGFFTVGDGVLNRSSAAS